MKRRKYKFREGCRIHGVDPQECGEWMIQLEKKYGKLTAARLLKEARSKASPIHDVLYKWNDARAAQEYRLELARHLLRSIVYVVVVPKVSPQPIEVRYFHNLPRGIFDDKADGYYTADRVMAHRPARDAVISEALRELEGWKLRYAVYSELSEIFAAIERTKKKFDK